MQKIPEADAGWGVVAGQGTADLRVGVHGVHLHTSFSSVGHHTFGSFISVTFWFFGYLRLLYAIKETVLKLDPAARHSKELGLHCAWVAVPVTWFSKVTDRSVISKAQF